MNRKTTVILGLLILSLLTSSFYAQVSAVSLVNRDPHFRDTGYWGSQHSMWAGTTTRDWHTIYMSRSKAVIRQSTWGNAWTWSNTEYGQGIKPWGPIGASLPEVRLTQQGQFISVKGKITEGNVNWFTGAVNVYINLWIHFDQPTGYFGLEWAEIFIALQCYDSLTKRAAAFERGYAFIRSDAGHKWYYIAYRPSPSLAMEEDSYVSFTLNNLYDFMERIFRINQNVGSVVGVTVGIEACQGSMTAVIDFIGYYA